MSKLKSIFERGRKIMRARYHWALAKKLQRTRRWRVVPTLVTPDGRGSNTAWSVRCQVRGWIRWHEWQGPTCETADEAIVQLKHLWLPPIDINANGDRLTANIISTFTTWVIAEKESDNDELDKPVTS